MNYKNNIVAEVSVFPVKSNKVAISFSEHCVEEMSKHKNLADFGGNIPDEILSVIIDTLDGWNDDGWRMESQYKAIRKSVLKEAKIQQWRVSGQLLEFKKSNKSKEEELDVNSYFIEIEEDDNDWCQIRLCAKFIENGQTKTKWFSGDDDGLWLAGNYFRHNLGKEAVFSDFF